VIAMSCRYLTNGYCSSDYTDGNEHPEWSIQIYDTTPGPDDPEYLRGLAEKLHRHTREEREAAGRGRSDRIDVRGMPLATNITEEERIEKCKAHFMAETAARDVAAVDGFHIPLLEANSQWQRAIVIIDRPQETWDEDEGGFLVVHCDVKPRWIQLLASVYGEDHQTLRTSAHPETLKELGSTLMNIRSGI
jgi:hypothetical protein